MNTWQVARQIQYILRAAVWPSSSTKIWDTDSVKVIELGSEFDSLQQGLIPPLAIISNSGGPSDPVGSGEEPNLIQRGITVTLVAVNQGDRVGEAAVVGAQRTGATDSRGRGVLELEPVLFDEIERMVSNLGINIAFSGFGAGATKKGPSDVWVAIQDYEFRMWGSAAKFFHPPKSLVGSSKTGQIDFTWRNPPDRWDRYRVRLRRASGATPPATITDGTEVALGSDLPTSFSNTGLAVGTYSYSLFATYSEFDTTVKNDDSFSSPISVASLQAF